MGLEFDKVSKEFSSFRAVDCVNYTMKKGVYGLLGVNGRENNPDENVMYYH